MTKQVSNAAAILAKMKQAKETKEVSKEAVALNSPIAAANEVSEGQSLVAPIAPISPIATTIITANTAITQVTPPPSRTFNYWSKAPNTEIALSNKPPIKFKGNAYQTSDSHEISILDEMTKRIPNVFSKVG